MGHTGGLETSPPVGYKLEVERGARFVAPSRGSLSAPAPAPLRTLRPLRTFRRALRTRAGRPEAARMHGALGSSRPPGAPVLPDRAPGGGWVRSADAGGAACGRPGRAGRPSPVGAGAGDDRRAGGGGARTWGRQPSATGLTGAQKPHPAWRTRAPNPRRPAPARGASAWAVDCRSSGGTCVREATNRVGRNGPFARVLARPSRDRPRGAADRKVVLARVAASAAATPIASASATANATRRASSSTPTTSPTSTSR
jgi:hypothetical protein